MKKEIGAQVISRIESNVGFDKVEYEFYGKIVKVNGKSLKVTITREVMKMNNDTFMDKQIENGSDINFWLDGMNGNNEIFKSRYFGTFEVGEEVSNSVAKKESGLTEKEEKVLRAIIAESNFNCNTLDISKSWNEQVLEDPEIFWAFADVKSYGCGMDKAQTRAIFGSLQKKGFIMVTKDDGCTWLTINEEQFNNIRKVLG